MLPIMVSVMSAKLMGDALGKDGIYSVWIAMRDYPWLPPVDYHDQGESAAGIMKSVKELIVIEDREGTLAELGEFPYRASAGQGLIRTPPCAIR